MSVQEQIEQRELGRDAGLLALHDRNDNRLVCAHMMSQAQREVRLFTRDLDKPIFDQEPFLTDLRKMVLDSRFNRARILLQDHDPAVKRGHRMIELARRLSSQIEIRVPPADWLEHPENFLLIDRYGYVHRELSTSYEATADYYDPLRVKRLDEMFDAVWQMSEVDSELRRLYI